VVISQPFWPAYLTAERIAKARNLKLAITAGIGSDHVDLDAAVANDIGPQLPALTPVGPRRRLEHRRLREPVLRRRGHADRHRGKICDRDAVDRALRSGRLAGYAGDVWFPQPAGPDPPGRPCRTTA
jgi:lactate dehydrogenase-like 2-hydroxyacid dehydrogenase